MDCHKPPGRTIGAHLEERGTNSLLTSNLEKGML